MNLYCFASIPKSGSASRVLAVLFRCCGPIRGCVVTSLVRFALHSCLTLLRVLVYSKWCPLCVHSENTYDSTHQVPRPLWHFEFPLGASLASWVPPGCLLGLLGVSWLQMLCMPPDASRCFQILQMPPDAWLPPGSLLGLSWRPSECLQMFDVCRSSRCIHTQPDASHARCFPDVSKMLSPDVSQA